MSEKPEKEPVSVPTDPAFYSVTDRDPKALSPAQQIKLLLQGYALFALVVILICGALYGWDAWRVHRNLEYKQHIEETLRADDPQRFIDQAKKAQEEADPVLSVLLAAEAQRLSPSAEGEKILRESLERLPHVVTLLQHEKGVDALAFSPDGRWIASRGDDNIARVWELSSGQEIARVQHAGSLTALVFSPDGRWVATGSSEGAARVWEAASGKEIARVQHAGSLTALVFSPDGRWVVSGSRDATVRVWEAASGQEISRMRLDPEEHKDDPNYYMGYPDNLWSISALVFSPDGRWVAAGNLDGAIRVWEAASGKEIVRMRLGDEKLKGDEYPPDNLWGVSALAFSPDGRWMLSGGCDDLFELGSCLSGSARVWEAASGREISRVEFESYVSTVAFSPDGSQVVSGGCSQGVPEHCTLGVARVWEAASGKEISHLKTGVDIDHVIFSPDGRLVFSSGCGQNGPKFCLSGIARVWEAATGREVARMPYGNGASSLALSPDGRRVAVGGTEEPTVTVWEIASGQVGQSDLLAEACLHLPRNLAADEWPIYFREPYHKTCPNLP